MCNLSICDPPDPLLSIHHVVIIQLQSIYDGWAAGRIYYNCGTQKVNSRFTIISKRVYGHGVATRSTRLGIFVATRPLLIHRHVLAVSTYQTHQPAITSPSAMTDYCNANKLYDQHITHLIYFNFVVFALLFLFVRLQRDWCSADVDITLFLF